MAKNSTICCPVLPEEESVVAQSCPVDSATATTLHLHDFPDNSFPFQGYPSWSPADNSSGAAAAGTSQSHRQAEKRRRDRINGQLARLRKLVPKSDKMDKAALLERVVGEIRELKRNTSEINKILTIPTETDDVTIECHTNTEQEIPISHDQNSNNNNNNNVVLIKATFCCEDRPDLISDLVPALKGLNLITIGADIACLGGRIKTILILYYKDDNNNSNNSNGDHNCNISAIKQSLMAVLTRLVSWSSSSSNFRVTSKRQRFFFSSS